MSHCFCFTIFMYIREKITKHKQTKKEYTKHQLVESYRTEKGPRQRILMQLGTLTLSKLELRKLAVILEARLAGQSSFFEDELELSHAADKAMSNYQFIQVKVEEKSVQKEKRELMTVDISSLGIAESRSLGPELVAHTYWERLGLDALLNSCGLTLSEQALAKAVIIARLIAPSSDLVTWSWLRNQTALLELLPVNLSEIGKDAAYEIADKLLIHKTKLEGALIQREKQLFLSETKLFLYDLTNTYFEGSCTDNSLANRGKSKEKRSDCPLVTLALVVDERGFPLHSQIFGGNQSEPETLSDILNRLYEQDEPDLFGHVRPTIVMDRGIATKDNLLLLKKKNYPYLVIERRVAKEAAIDTLKEKRFLHDLTNLQKSVAKGNVILEAKVGERIGRLKERYPSIAGHYQIKLE